MVENLLLAGFISITAFTSVMMFKNRDENERKFFNEEMKNNLFQDSVYRKIKDQDEEIDKLKKEIEALKIALSTKNETKEKKINEMDFNLFNEWINGAVEE